jgi:sugar phosphate isomerase/epimerase
MLESKEACLKTAAAFEEVSQTLADYGMVLGFHNHSIEFKPVEGDIPFHYLFDNTTRLAMQLDNGNALSAGPDTDIFDPLTRYAGRSRTIHLKPYSNTKGFATMIGEDDIDLPRFFDICHKTQNVLWYIVEYEVEDLYPALEGAEKCLQALQSMGKAGKLCR